MRIHMCTECSVCSVFVFASRVHGVLVFVQGVFACRVCVRVHVLVFVGLRICVYVPFFFLCIFACVCVGVYL